MTEKLIFLIFFMKKLYALMTKNNIFIHKSIYGAKKYLIKKLNLFPTAVLKKWKCFLFL